MPAGAAPVSRELGDGSVRHGKIIPMIIEAVEASQVNFKAIYKTLLQIGTMVADNVGAGGGGQDRSPAVPE